jgi:hypothetical protein
VSECDESRRIVAVSHLVDIPEDVAVAVPGEDGVIYIANRRCTGVSGDDAIRDCLKTTFTRAGRSYSPVEIPGLEITDASVGSGTLKQPDGERVAEALEVALDGVPVPSSVAVAVAGGFYVALDACKGQGPPALQAALVCQ